jgi:hypothetical protein
MKSGIVIPPALLKKGDFKFFLNDVGVLEPPAPWKGELYVTSYLPTPKSQVMEE